MGFWDGRGLSLRVFSEIGKEREAMSMVGLNTSYDWLSGSIVLVALCSNSMVGRLPGQKIVCVEEW